MSAPRSWRVVATARGFDGTPEAAALLRDAGCELVTTERYSDARFDYELGGVFTWASLAVGFSSRRHQISNPPVRPITPRIRHTIAATGHRPPIAGPAKAGRPAGRSEHQQTDSETYSHDG